MCNIHGSFAHTHTHAISHKFMERFQSHRIEKSYHTIFRICFLLRTPNQTNCKDVLEHEVILFITSDQNPLALLKHTLILCSKMCFIKQNYYFHILYPSTTALPSFCLSHKSPPSRSCHHHFMD